MRLGGEGIVVRDRLEGADEEEVTTKGSSKQLK
jgi:hypothetical protein